MAQIESVLTAEEPVLYEGQPTRFVRPRLSLLISYAALLAMGVFLVVVAWSSVRGYPATSWELGWGTINFKGTRGTSTSSSGMPSPLVWLVLIAMTEFLRQAWVRSLRVVVTPRRVLFSQGVFRSKLRVLVRAGGEQVAEVPGGLRLWGDGGVVDLPGFSSEHAEGLRTGLQTFDDTPPPPLPEPLVSKRRLALLLICLVLGGAVFGWWRGTRQAVSLQITWTARPAPGIDQLGVRVEGPNWVERNLELFKVQVLDAATGAPLNPNSGSGGGGTGLLRTYRSSDEAIARGTPRVRVILAVRWRAPDAKTSIDELSRVMSGVAAPGEFELELGRGEDRSWTLVEGEAGQLRPESED